MGEWVSEYMKNNQRERKRKIFGGYRCYDSSHECYFPLPPSLPSSQHNPQDVSPPLAGVWCVLYVSLVPEDLLQAGTGSGGHTGHHESSHHTRNTTNILCPRISTGTPI